MNTSHTPKYFVLTLVIVSGLVLTACGGGRSVEWKAPVIIVTPTLTSQQTIQLSQVCSTGGEGVAFVEGGAYYPCPAGSGSTTTTSGPAATAMPGATSASMASDCSSLGSYALVQTVPFGQPGNPILSNMDIGDPSLTAVIQAWDGKDVTTTFHALVISGNNLDFERQSITGTFFLFSGNETAIACRAQQMWGEAGGNAYRLHVGPGTPLDGWNTEFPTNGWTMKTWAFVENEILTPGANWSPVSVQTGDATHTYEGLANGQFWNGTDASKVYHFIVEERYEISTPKYQGTLFNVAGGDFDTVVQRMIQMTSEVILRDDHPTVVQIYCGANTLAGWNPPPAGWSCVKQ